MAGYGVPIVFGGVQFTSSVVIWGIAAWKRWRNGGSDDPDDDSDGSDDGKNNDKLLVDGA